MLSYKKIDEEEEGGNLLRERQKEIVENMAEGLVVHGADGRILSINGAAEKFLNARYLDVKGKKVGYDPLKSGGSMFYFTLPVYEEEK